MAKKYFILFFVGFVLFLVNTNAHAFDGQRKGFLLGIGLGPGFTSFTQEVAVSIFGFHESVKSDRENKAGVISDLKIGYAPNIIPGRYTIPPRSPGSEWRTFSATMSPLPMD